MAEFLKIAMIGTGAIGGYYGARLAKSGRDVRFLLRSDFAPVRERGLRVTLPDNAWTLYPVQAYDSTREIGPVDLVILGLKATANRALADLLPPLLAQGTAILTLENGLGCDELLAAEFGQERVIGGICFIAVIRTGPGDIHCIHPGSISLAEFAKPCTSRLAELARLFTDAGVTAAAGDNLAELRWRKLVWNIPFNGLSIAAGNVTTQRILSDSTLEAEARALMAEVIEAATKLGYQIPRGYADHQVELTRPLGPYSPSSLIDHLAGREIELEAIWGEPLRRAKAVGLEMPRLDQLYRCLKELTKVNGPSR